MAEYIAIADHTANSNKSFSYIRLKNTDKAFAFAEGARKGFDLENVYCIHIAKKVKKNVYRSLCLVRQHVTVESKENEKQEWRDFTVFDNDFEKSPKFS